MNNRTRTQSNIQTYFAGCLRQWNVLMDLIQFIWVLSDRWEFDDRASVIQNHSVESDKKLSEYEPVGKMIKEEDDIRVFQTLLEEVTAKFNRRHQDREPIEAAGIVDVLARNDIHAWHDLKNAIMDKKDELIKAILREKIPFFQLDKK
jgi:hypothetical protein